MNQEWYESSPWHRPEECPFPFLNQIARLLKESTEGVFVFPGKDAVTHGSVNCLGILLFPLGGNNQGLRLSIKFYCLKLSDHLIPFSG